MRYLAPALAIGLAACATVPRTPVVSASSPYPPACAVRFAPNPTIADWSADKFTGSFRAGAHQLIVRREGNTLTVRQPDKLPTQVNGNVQTGLFRDGCGTVYQFTLPPDGPGGMVTVTTPAGTKSIWHRSGS